MIRCLSQVVAALGTLPRFTAQAAADGLDCCGECRDEGKSKKRNLDVARGEAEWMDSQRDIERAKVPPKIVSPALTFDRKVGSQRDLWPRGKRPGIFGFPAKDNSPCGHLHAAKRGSVLSLSIRDRKNAHESQHHQKHRGKKAMQPECSQKSRLARFTAGLAKGW